MKYTQQKSSDKIWTDESGTEIPYNRTTKVERLHERLSAKIAKQAILTHKRLVAFNDLISELSNEAYEAYLASENITNARKGNFKWHNFDGSIKIEIAVNEPIVFDDLKIQAAQAKFDEFLNREIQAENEFVKDMVIDAFKTTRGKLDTKRVLGLTRYESRVNKPLFTEAVKLVNAAITRPKSKTYRRVWIKNEEGKYENIELNLSSL